MRDFESINRTKYHSDFLQFIMESNYEDFYTDNMEDVYVSTIHKAKGREFDYVYMLLNGNEAESDEEYRKLYVGMTRAKRNLYIHTNTEIFDHYTFPEVVHLNDPNRYNAPETISIPLTYKDVVLNFFKDKKRLILKLRSGQNLTVNYPFLSAEIDRKQVNVAKFSQKFCKQLDEFNRKGYTPVAAKVQFIAAWKGDNDPNETAVLLSEMVLKK